MKKVRRTKKQQKDVRRDVDIIASKLHGGDERKKQESLSIDKAKVQVTCVI